MSSAAAASWTTRYAARYARGHSRRKSSSSACAEPRCTSRTSRRSRRRSAASLPAARASRLVFPGATGTKAAGRSPVIAATELLTRSTRIDTAERMARGPCESSARALGGVALAHVLGSPRFVAAGGGRCRAAVAGGVPRGGGWAVRARAGRHRRGAPPPRRRAHAGAPLAAARANRRRAREPALLRRLVHRDGHPRAVVARARAPRLEGAGLARGPAALAAARVLAPRDRREQPGPAAAVLARRVPALRALGVALRGRRRVAVGADPVSPRGDRAPAARGRPARVPALGTRRDAARRHHLQHARARGRPCRGGGPGHQPARRARCARGPRGRVRTPARRRSSATGAPSSTRYQAS